MSLTRRTTLRVNTTLILAVTALALALTSGLLTETLLRTVYADNTPQTLPFTQNWSNNGLITANDNWSGVPGIEGFLGQDITTATGTDPQTLLTTSGVANDLDVIANQTNTAITNGGVAEFHSTSQGGAPGTDSTIALQGSGTADAPYVLLYLNTTGVSNINVAYNVRDIDCTADNAIQQLALQFRVGTTGNFTNVPAGYISDATTGPSICTAVTPVSVALPAAAENQAILQVRMISSNAVGNDEWIGIDDINITGVGGATILNINNVTQNEGNAGTTNFTFTVSLSSPAGANGVNFNWNTADGTAQDGNPSGEDNDYIPVVDGSGFIPAGESATTVTVEVIGDTTPEPNETFFVNITNVSNATPGDVQGQGNITNDDIPFVQIHTIQGSGTASPFDGLTVSTIGIVTLLKTGTNNGGPASGFFMQDTDPDGDPNTSEGIFVFTSSVPTVAVGDIVTLTATVDEFNNLTELVGVTSLTINSTGNPLPTPVILTPTILDPTALPTQPQLEKFEGMRMFADTLISVAPNDNFFDVFTVLRGVPRPMREPGIEISLPVPPDPSSGVPDCCIPRWDENPERLLLDTNGRAGAPLSPYTSNVVFNNVAGPLDFAFGAYRLIPDAPLAASPNMSAIPVPTPTALEFTIAGFNIENFNGNATQQTKAALAIRDVMRLPHIIGLAEIFDLADLQALATQVNTLSGTSYVAHLIEANGTTGDNDQDVAFLVDTNRVQVNSVVQEELPGCMGTAATCNTYIDPNTGMPALLNDRPPLVLNAVVQPSGINIPVIVVVNHLRSFIDIELVAGEGPRVRAKRKAQAEFLANLLQTLQTNNPTNNIISVGDYNAYQFNDGYTDPIATIKGNPTPDDQVVVDASPDLVNPDFINLIDKLPASERYSFIFEGTPQALDHIIVNSVANARFRRIAVARNNADFPETPATAFATNAARPERNSDHDMPVAYFGVEPTAANGLVTGRITDEQGNPVSGTVIRLTGTQTRKVITDANGFYRFENVETSGFYTVTPSRANFLFQPVSRSFSQLGQNTEAAFTAATTGQSANPLDTAEYFVRQQYVDMLNREPDEGGFNYWSDRILECDNNASCEAARRREVAAAFFIEQEFQLTGSFIYGLYKGGLGRRPIYSEFSIDRQQVVIGPTLEATKQALAESFVSRNEFQSRYQTQNSAESFVDELLANVQQASGVDLRSQRATLIGRYQTGANLNHSRSLVLRELIELEGFRHAEYNRAFVLAEYFNYLRREPDQGGYDFWLNVVNNRDVNNYTGMVCAFINSREYQQRFSSIVTRTDRECGP